MNKFPLLLVTFLLSIVINLEAASAAPTVSPTVYANHVIIHTFNSNAKSFAVLDDSSLWELNPEHPLAQNAEILINEFVTIMPDTGSSDYPVTFVISNKVDSMLVKLVSIPSEGSTLEEIDPSGAFVKFEDFVLEIAPYEVEIVKTWKEHQKAIVGGVWFPEYDPQGRADCEYLYTLYNYETKTCVHFTYEGLN